MLLMATRTFNTPWEYRYWSGGHRVTSNKKKEDEEVAESQKLSPRDKKEIEEGLCVNCALVSILFTIFLMVAMVL